MEPTSAPARTKEASKAAASKAARAKAASKAARTKGATKAAASKAAKPKGASKAAGPKATEADLEQSHDKVQRGKGPVGSRENPEVYEDVPGHVIPILEDEFDDFDTEAGRFLDGETSEEQFIGFRLKQGVYGQRQPGVQMIRVKLPIGGVTPEQMDAFASVIEKYVPLGKGHITTRQNVQMHHVPLPDAAELI
ncbi:MAG: hypothetical protein KJ006_06595, partial [Thermoleophilia bacterium]|nr:hypothetical protein [Thermoleophilia bacterium]